MSNPPSGTARLRPQTFDRNMADLVPEFEPAEAAALAMLHYFSNLHIRTSADAHYASRYADHAVQALASLPTEEILAVERMATVAEWRLLTTECGRAKFEGMSVRATFDRYANEILGRNEFQARKRAPIESAFLGTTVTGQSDYRRAVNRKLRSVKRGLLHWGTLPDADLRTVGPGRKPRKKEYWEI